MRIRHYGIFRLRVAWAAAALGFFCLASLIAAQAADGSSSEPVMAQLAVIKTPASGRTGQVLWVASPNLSAERAELVFRISGPGMKDSILDQRQFMLIRDRLIEQTCEFNVSAPGVYKITALLRVTREGRVLAHQAETSLVIRPDGTAQKLGALAVVAPAQAPAGGGAPVIDDFWVMEIDNIWLPAWDTVAFNTHIKVGLECEGNPTQCMISETATFSGAAWRPYESEMDFTLSPTNGRKVLYVKVKDAQGAESAVKTDSLILFQATELAPGSHKIQGRITRKGEVDWYFVNNQDGMVSFMVEAWNGSLKDTVISIFDTDGDKLDKTPGRLLDQIRNDSKDKVARVYGYSYRILLIKVQAKSNSATGTYSLRLSARPQEACMGSAYVTYDKTRIQTSEYGYTDRRDVGVYTAVNLDYIEETGKYTRKPTEYMISESPVFEGASWKKIDYKKATRATESSEGSDITIWMMFDFTLSKNLGNKTVYIRMRYSDGYVADEGEADVYLTGLQTMKVNGPTVHGEIRGFGDCELDSYDYWYSFKAVSAGTYRIQFNNDIERVFSDDYLYRVSLYGPNSRSKQVGSEYRGTSPEKTISYQNLAKGTYYLEVEPAIQDHRFSDGDIVEYFPKGPYSISVAH